MQITVKQLKFIIENFNDDLPVFFRRISPMCGNIEEAGRVVEATYSFFGQEFPCVIIEPVSNIEGDEDSSDANASSQESTIPGLKYE